MAGSVPINTEDSSEQTRLVDDKFLEISSNYRASEFSFVHHFVLINIFEVDWLYCILVNPSLLDTKFFHILYNH